MQEERIVLFLYICINTLALYALVCNKAQPLFYIGHVEKLKALRALRFSFTLRFFFFLLNICFSVHFFCSLYRGVLLKQIQILIVSMDRPRGEEKTYILVNCCQTLF